MGVWVGGGEWVVGNIKVKARVNNLMMTVWV